MNRHYRMIYYIENAFPIHLRRLDIMRFFRDEWSLKEYVVGYHLNMKYVINSTCSIVNVTFKHETIRFIKCFKQLWKLQYIAFTWVVDDTLVEWFNNWSLSILSMARNGRCQRLKMLPLVVKITRRKTFQIQFHVFYFCKAIIIKDILNARNIYYIYGQCIASCFLCASYNCNLSITFESLGLTIDLQNFIFIFNIDILFTWNVITHKNTRIYDMLWIRNVRNATMMLDSLKVL